MLIQASSPLRWRGKGGCANNSTAPPGAEGGAWMKFYTQQHRFYCGIDLHAKRMYICILNAEGTIVYHQNGAAGPEHFLRAIATGAPSPPTGDVRLLTTGGLIRVIRRLDAPPVVRIRPEAGARLRSVSSPSSG